MEGFPAQTVFEAIEKTIYRTHRYLSTPSTKHWQTLDGDALRFSIHCLHAKDHEGGCSSFRHRLLLWDSQLQSLAFSCETASVFRRCPLQEVTEVAGGVDRGGQGAAAAEVRAGSLVSST